ncbi:hypothetical protein PHSY_004463 [Pseudozyma hubeiensis SY62]|uniref:Uncharacterized protein n=1 Tax=Pseudozyma hubeiensis (strain SY62) TaxID=1305764 RepID=R9P6D1_PSEHS|nr:hypothetical protein PHSY_004463 [Pseudozyma hubeiensis SY62]GAC96879.1 hypothetical protein PHSY_004463 [Pseudozyma hubeiensis SY62]
MSAQYYPLPAKGPRPQAPDVSCSGILGSRDPDQILSKAARHIGDATAPLFSGLYDIRQLCTGLDSRRFARLSAENLALQHRRLDERRICICLSEPEWRRLGAYTTGIATSDGVA